MRIKLLMLLYSNTDTCSLYRSGGIASDLRRRMDIDIDTQEYNKALIHWQFLLGYDMVMMQRPFNDHALTLASYIKNLGIPVWMDWDDYILDVPAENKMHPYLVREKETILKLIKMADVISVATRLLKKEFSQYNENIRVIPNAFNDVIFKNYKPPKQKETILWRGSPEHVKDLVDFKIPLNAVIEVLPEYRFVFAGLKPWMLEERPNIAFAPVVDPFVYYNQNRREAPTLLHVPLYDHIFNRSKSNLGYIEAADFGAVCLCPNWEEWQVPGAVLYNDKTEYAESFIKILKGEFDTKKMAKTAWEYVTDTLMLSKINQLRVELINDTLYKNK